MAPHLLTKPELIDRLKETYGEDQLATVAKPTLPPKEPSPPAPTNGSASRYTCCTQFPNPLRSAAVHVGLDFGTERIIPRWKKGSVVNWTALRANFPTPDQATLATSGLNAAAETWNSKNIGVTFKFVSKLDDAAFALTYGGDEGGVLASAFFPNEEPLNWLQVYSTAFEEEHIRILKNVFIHELGHVIGLRHEFAETGTPFLNKEGGSILVGEKNELSVMSYNFPPTIQQSDIDSAKQFYELTVPDINGVLLKSYVPDN